jgi:hypothetical protein
MSLVGPDFLLHCPRHEGVEGSKCISPLILNLGPTFESSFTPRPLYPREKSPRYSLNRGLGGPHSRSGNFGEEINLLTFPGFEPRYFGSIFHSLDTTLTELSRLSVPYISCDLDVYKDGQTDMPKLVCAVLHALCAPPISSESWMPCNVAVPSE